MPDPAFVVAGRTEDEIRSIREQLRDSDLFLSMKSPSIFEAYERGRVCWTGRSTIVYLHADVEFIDLTAFMEQLRSLPPGTHGVVGTNDPEALDKSPWWERNDRHGTWKQNFPDGTPERVFTMGIWDRSMPIRMMDGVMIITVDQKWDWKIPGNPPLWHGYDWYSCKKTIESGGQCFTLAQPKGPILKHYGWGRMNGFFEAMETLRSIFSSGAEKGK